MWESDDEDVHQSHGTRKFCAHHHPALAKGQYHAETGPPSNLLQGFSQSTMETMSTITTATSLPPMGNIKLLANPYLLMDKKTFLIIKRMTMTMLKNFLPFNIFGIAPILKKNHPTGWKCLWCSDVFVPVHATRALNHVIRFKGGGIKPCKASIPANYLARYQAMRDDGSSKADYKKRGVEVVDHIVMMHSRIHLLQLYLQENADVVLYLQIQVNLI
jgi:hypothetical protein